MEGENLRQERVPSLGPTEVRVEQAAEVAEGIRVLEEQRRALGRSRGIFLSLLGLVTVLAAVETRDPLFVGLVVLMFAGAFGAYRLNATRLDDRIRRAEEEFAKLTSSSG